MSTQRFLPVISGQQNFENFLEFSVNPKKYKAQYEALKTLAEAAGEQVSKVGKAKEIDGMHKRARQDVKAAHDTLQAAQKKAQGMINEAEGVVGALYADFEEVEAAHKTEYEEFRREQATAIEELGRREETAATMREEAAEATASAGSLLTTAKKTQADYEAKAKAMAALI